MSRFRNSLLASLVALPLALGGCKSHDFRETSRDKDGTVTYGASKGIDSSSEMLKMSTCNDGTLLGYEGWPIKSPVIKYVGKKSTFVEGEPIEFWLESKRYDGVGRTNFRAELSRNGEEITERLFVTQINPQWVVVPYLGLASGNYTVSCYSLDEFLGKIDFEVVKLNHNNLNSGSGALQGSNVGGDGAKVGGAGAGVGASNK